MAPKPKPVFDLDALEVETTNEPFVFTFGGKQYVVPAIIDLRITAALRQGDYATAVRVLVGEDQWASIVASDAVLDTARADTLIRAFGEHCGASPGKSGGSPSS